MNRKAKSLLKHKGILIAALAIFVLSCAAFIGGTTGFITLSPAGTSSDTSASYLLGGPAIIGYSEPIFEALNPVPDFKAPEQKVSPALEEQVKVAIANEPEKKISVLIQVKDEAQLNALSKIVEDRGGEIQGSFGIGNTIVADLPPERVAELSEQDDVFQIGADLPVTAMLDNSVPHINGSYAWDLGYTGAGVKIAVLDTGVQDNHPMLDSRVILQKSFIDGVGVADVWTHGTHCAGIAAGSKTAGGLYDGVATEALIMNGKVLDDNGQGSFSGVIAGINWAVDPDGNPATDDGADIISLSLGAAANDPYSAVSMAIKDAMDAGVAVVVSSGNCGLPNICQNNFVGVTTPGDSPYAITVGAVDNQDNIASFSSRGLIPGVLIDGQPMIKPDVVAPGVDVFSSIPGSQYMKKSGTSMAAPHVAGAVALLLQANPE
ncbi:MAG: S8 family serine peptidase, partial [archaeon]